MQLFDPSQRDVMSVVADLASFFSLAGLGYIIFYKQSSTSKEGSKDASHGRHDTKEDSKKYKLFNVPVYEVSTKTTGKIEDFEFSEERSAKISTVLTVKEKGEK